MLERPSQVEYVGKKSAKPTDSWSTSAIRTSNLGCSPNPSRNRSAVVVFTASGSFSNSARPLMKRRIVSTSAAVAGRITGGGIDFSLDKNLRAHGMRPYHGILLGFRFHQMEFPLRGVAVEIDL